MREIAFRIKLDKVLKERSMTQLDLARIINEERAKRGIEKKVRTAGISELYNNQRKSINRELIEEIVTVLNITDISEIAELHSNEKAPE